MGARKRRLRTGDRVAVFNGRSKHERLDVVAWEDRHFVYLGNGSRYWKNGNPVNYGQKTKLRYWEEE